MEAWLLIQGAHAITLLTHKSPDADGVSACCALSLIFNSQGKKVETICPDTPKKPAPKQPASFRIASHSFIPDLIIVCDTANRERMYFPECFKNIPLINIDHHISNSIAGTVDIINPTASSCCEELFFFIQANELSLMTKEIAECLLTGIMYDSKAFHTSSTSPTTLQIAADLIKSYDIDWVSIKNEMLGNPLPVVTFWGELLSKLCVSNKKNAVWARITQAQLHAHGLSTASLEGFSNLLAEICMIDIVIIFYETEEHKSKASFRSKYADVNALAQWCGGGGHINASGVSSDLPLDELIKQVTALLG